MRKAILTSIFALKCLLFVQLLQAQAPQSFSYQAVLRDEKGLPLAKGIEPGLSISLRQGSRTGAVVYNETYQKGGNPALRSNDFGIITLEVGKLKPNDFGQINWGSGPFFLEVKYDPAGGNNYITLSEPIQILSVPYAIYADYAAQVAPENLQLRYNNTTNELSISGGNTVIIPRNSGGPDADADPKNEHITQLRLNGNVLEITEAGNNTKTVDLSALKSNSADNDTDPKNEHITNIRLNGTILEVSEAGGNLKSVDLNPLKGGATITYKAGTGIAISADNTISNTGDTNPADDITNASIAQGDVEGTFYKLVVKALAGHPIASISPAQGQVLTWNNHRWEPGDLALNGGDNFWKKDTTTQNVYYEKSVSIGTNAIGETALGGLAGLTLSQPLAILGEEQLARFTAGVEKGGATKGAGFITLRDPNKRLSVLLGSGTYDNQLIGGRISLHIENDDVPSLILGTDSGLNNENPIGYISTQNNKSKKLYNPRTTFLGGNFHHAEYGELALFNSELVVDNYPKINVVLTQNPGYEGGTVQVHGKNGISFGELQAEPTGAFLRIANSNSKCRVKTYVTDQDEGIIDLVDPVKDSCYFSDLIIQSVVIPKGNARQSVGFIGFDDDQGNLKMALSLDTEQNAYINTGTVTAENIFAKVKNFKIPHPEDASKSIVYACIEGPEAAAYERGTAKLINGEAFIPYSGHFALVINAQTLTVHVTPLFDDTFGLAVVEKTEKGFKVRELKGGKGNFSFDWEVKAVRKGYENYQAVRPK